MWLIERPSWSDESSLKILGDDTPLSVFNCFKCLNYRKSIRAMSVVELA